MNILQTLFGVHSPLYTQLLKLFSGAQFVGEDTLGNRYYKAKARKGYKRERRWVMYKGQAEASKVPPEWHGWLHHQMDESPAENQASFRRPWQKPHKENLTGTTEAYRPPGHVLAGQTRDGATGDYEAWTPSDD